MSVKVDVAEDAGLIDPNEEIDLSGDPEFEDAGDDEEPTLPFKGIWLQAVCIRSTSPRQTAAWIIANFRGRTLYTSHNNSLIIVQAAIGSMMSLEIEFVGPLENIELENNRFGFNINQRDKFDSVNTWLKTRTDIEHIQTNNDAYGNEVALYEIPGSVGLYVRYWKKTLVLFPELEDEAK